MHKKNNLFDLIMALTPSEKRYFRQSLSGRSNKESKNYLRLFNALDKMNVYDESVLKSTFKGETFTKQLHVTKIYLHDSILKSLRLFHAQSSSSMVIKDHLKNIEVCFNKELYNVCAIEIQKAEKIASKIEDDLSLLEVLNWKRKLAQNLSPQTLNVLEVINLQGTKLQRLQRVHKLWELLVGLSNDSVPEVQDATSLNEIVLQSHLNYRTEIQKGRNDEAKRCLQELIKVLEASPERISEDPGIYLSSLNNLLSFFVFTRQHEEALSLLARAKTFYEKTDRAKRSQNNFRQILRMYNIELEIYRDTEELEKGIALMREIQDVIRLHAGTTPREYLISLWFQFAYIFFLKREFKSSLHWINEIMNSSFAHLRPDLHIQTHLLNLMVHFELRNFFVMRYFVDATKRFGKKNQSFKDHHKKLIDFFSRISGVPEAEYGGLFEKLHAEVVLKKLIPQNDLDYINWNKWITSKVRRT